MKTFKGIGLFFVAICFAVLLFEIGFALGLRTRGKNKISEELVRGQDMVEEILPDATAATKDFSPFLDASSNSGMLRMDTEFFVCEVNDDTGEKIETIKDLPTKYVGLDLEGFMEVMEQYNAAPPLSEREKGFEYLEVLRFSRDRVMIQKHYSEKKRKNGYYLAIMDHHVVVLCEDQSTIYMTTDISLQMLPENVREELINKRYVENEMELFDFLEAYTS